MPKKVRVSQPLKALMRSPRDARRSASATASPEVSLR